MTNIVTVLLNAKDNISGMLGGLKNNLRGLGGSADPLQQSIFGAGLQMKAFDAAIGLATSSISVLNDQLMTAVKLQTDITVAGDTIGKNMGVGLAGGTKLLRDTRLELGKVADMLPGVTTDYTNVGNAVMPQLSKLGLSKEELQELTVKISTGGGFMGATTGMGGVAGANMSKLLGGSSSIKELMSNDIFERYTGDAKGKMQAALSRAGVKDTQWQQLTPLQRAKIVADFSSTIATPELAAELSKGLDSKLATLTSSIFDPERGILGFLKPIVARGGRTGLDAATELFDVLTKLGGLFVGLNLDGVMTAIIDSIDWFSTLGYTILGMSAGGDNAIGAIYKNLYDGAVGWINTMIASARTAIENIPFGQLGFMAGQALANLYEAVQNIDWGGVLLGALSLLAGVIEGVIGFFAGVISTLFMNTFNKIAERLKGLFGFLGGIFGVIGSAFSGFATGFKYLWETALSIIQPIVDFFVSGFENTVGAVKAVTGVASSPVASGAAEATVSAPIVGAGGSLKTGASGLGRALADKVTGNVTPLPEVKPDNKSTSFAPVITLNANANMSTKDQVDMLMSAINSRYTEYQQGVLA